MEDLNEAGGVYAVMKELTKKNLLNLDCMTCTGKTVGENIRDAENRDPEVIRQEFGLSKKTFKKILGTLFREGKIILENDGFRSTNP